TGNGRARPDGHHAVPVFAEDERVNLSSRGFETARQVAPKAGGVELGAETDDPLPRQTAALHGLISQHVDRIADNDKIRVVFKARLFDFIEDTEKEIDIAVDQIQPAFVGLAAQASGNDDDIARRDVAVITGADALVGDETGAVQEIEGLALGH